MELPPIPPFAGVCWTVDKNVAWNGYAVVSGITPEGVRRREYLHRAVYELLRGPIPDGMVIDHLCKVRNCVNPWHMEVVTPAVNALRGDSPRSINARKILASCGHPFDEVLIEKTSTGTREIRIHGECHRERKRATSQAWRDARKAVSQ